MDPLPRPRPLSDRLWPDQLWVVRHGESAGNLARDRAEAASEQRIDLAHRDVDVPLSADGERQASSLGRWLAGLADPPTRLWVSPYVRARETAAIALDTAGMTLPTTVDERLREREFGVLDGLTGHGIRARFPEEAERRRVIGKFYHRPPGGESWCDVALRLRAALDDLAVQTAGERVLLVAHQVVVLLSRYVLEQLDEAGVLAIDRQSALLNCSVTSFVRDGGALRLAGFNDASHLDQPPPAAATAEPDGPVGPR